MTSELRSSSSRISLQFDSMEHCRHLVKGLAFHVIHSEWEWMKEGRKEGNILFNDALNTFYLQLYGVGHMVKDHSDMRKETRCRHIGYSFRLTARVLLYAPSHRQDSTYHSLCYTSRGALAGMRNSSMGPPHEGSIRRPIAPWANALTTELHLAPEWMTPQHEKQIGYWVSEKGKCMKFI